MATTHAEYLDYKERVGQQLSQRKMKISELKDQLANLDVTPSKDMSNSIRDYGNHADVILRDCWFYRCANYATCPHCLFDFIN